MAKINKIEFYNFRNFEKFETHFHKKLNIFYGDNGCGKTNILEGISIISKGTGIRNAKIFDLIKINKDNFLIKNELEIKKNLLNVKVYSEKKNDKYNKVVDINNDLSKESKDYLNRSTSFLTFLPEMERLFQSSPSYRRNFLDRLIYSSKIDYNKTMNKYKKYLLERIKIIQNDNYDENWLNQIEKEISKLGLEIYKLRSEQIEIINKKILELNSVNQFPFLICLKIKDAFFKEKITFEEYLSYLHQSRAVDKQYGGTKVGPHRSDFNVLINTDFDASLLSTGQQKTIVLMILLAQCSYLVNIKKIIPVLLLDEIGSHLDSNNRKILLDMIYKFDIQFFLTGTDKNLFSFVSTNAEFYNITKI